MYNIPCDVYDLHSFILWQLDLMKLVLTITGYYKPNQGRQRSRELERMGG